MDRLVVFCKQSCLQKSDDGREVQVPYGHSEHMPLATAQVLVHRESFEPEIAKNIHIFMPEVYSSPKSEIIVV